MHVQAGRLREAKSRSDKIITRRTVSSTITRLLPLPQRRRSAQDSSGSEQRLPLNYQVTGCYLPKEVLRTQRGSMKSAGVTTLSMLASALLLATSREWLPAAKGDDPPIGVWPTFSCSSGSRQLHLAANSSWQAVTMKAQNQYFTGDCSLQINISTYVDRSTSVVAPSQPQQHLMSPPLLLLKIDQVNLATNTDGTCDDAVNSLNVFQHNRSRDTGYICNFSSAYIWTNESIELYMYAKASYFRTPSFSAAFVVTAEYINMCHSAVSSVERQIERELYVFAPDSRYSKSFANYVACLNTNYTMSFEANSLTGGLSLAVLESPPGSSCCSLFLDGQHCGDGCTQSFGPSSRSTLLYSCDGCSDDNNPGFTLRVAVVSQTTTQISATSKILAVTLTSSSSRDSDTYTRDTATPLNILTPPSSNLQVSVTGPSISGSSSLSSRLLATFAIDAEPASSTYSIPELISVSSGSPSRLPSSSPGVFGSEENGAAPSAAPSAALVVGAVVGSIAGVAIVVTVSAVFAKRYYRSKCAKAVVLKESDNFRQSGTAPLTQMSPPLINSSLFFDATHEKSATDFQVAMIDNDLYVAMK